MDDLTAALAGSFQVTSHPNNPAAPHPRFSDYKIKTNVPNQEVRRQRVLQKQKQNRFDYVNHIRCLTENSWESFVDSDEDGEDAAEEMDVDVDVVRRPGRYYKNQLMLSEWMMEKPEEFESEWVMVPCPVGKRNLIVTFQGGAKVYTRSGKRIETFVSCLPGKSILDCIYHEEMKTFYVLDIMCWHGHQFYECETEFRFYWLQTKMEEFPELKDRTKNNKYCFEALPNFACSEESIASVMATPMNIQMDGLLFYHKRTHYTFGPTPLVVWLKSYMIPDMLGIPVHPKYIADKPAAYTGLAKHLELVQENKDKREAQTKSSAEKSRTPNKPSADKMDTSASCNDGSKREAQTKSSPKKSRTPNKPSADRMDTSASCNDGSTDT